MRSPAFWSDGEIMMGTRVLTAAVLFCVSVATGWAGGGAWTRVPDGYYVKIGLTSLTAERQYRFDGRLQRLFPDTSAFRDGEYGATDISFYGELGMTKWLTGTVATQYKVAVRKARYLPTGRDSTASASGLGDVWVGARMKVIPGTGPYAGAITVSVKLPTGSPLQDIPLGTGVVDYEIAAAGGLSFPVPLLQGQYGYAQATGAYRLRNGTQANEFNYGAEVGVGLSEEFMLQATYDGAMSLADFDAVAPRQDDPAVVAPFQYDQSFARWSAGFIYKLNETLNLTGGYVSSVGGINSLDLSGVMFGVAWSR